MNQEEFLSAVAELLSTFKITDQPFEKVFESLVKKYLTAKANPAEHTPFLLKTIIEQIVEKQHNLTQPTLINLVIKLVQTLETDKQELQKMKDKNNRAVNKFLVSLMLKTKQNSALIKQAAIISALSAECLESSFILNVNLLDTINLLVEMAKNYINKDITYQCIADIKTFKAKNTALAITMLRLLMDAICSIYHEKMEVTIDLSENSFTFSILITEHAHLFDWHKFDYNTVTVFGTEPYFSVIQKIISAPDTTLTLHKNSIRLNTPLTNVELREDFVCLYPNILTEKMSYKHDACDLQELLLQRIIQISADNIPLPLSVFEEVKGELCSFLTVLIPGFSPADKTNDPEFLFQNLSNLHASICAQVSTNTKDNTVILPTQKSKNYHVLFTESPLQSSGESSSSATKSLSKKNSNKLSLLRKEASPKRRFSLTRPFSSKAKTPSTPSTSPLLKKSLFSNSFISFNSLCIPNLVGKLLPFLLLPETLSDHYQRYKQKKQESKEESVVNPLQQMIEILTKLANQLKTYEEGSYDHKLSCLITTLLKIYNDFNIEIYDEQSKMPRANVNFPALLIGTKLGPRLIKQSDAYALLGIDSSGQNGVNPYMGASHFVKNIKGVHYKLDCQRSGVTLATGKEQFVQRILMEMFPKKCSLFLTPTALLRVSNVYTDNYVEKIPQFINASLTVEGVALSDWLIINESAVLLKDCYGIEALKMAIRSWICEDYISDQPANKLYQDIIKNQATMKPDNRLIEFIEIQKVSDRMEQVFNQLLNQEGEIKLKKVLAFVHNWPELVAGFNLFEVAKWVPIFSRLPEFFLQIPSEQIKLLMEENTTVLTMVINKICDQLVEFWQLLDLPSALALTIASQAVNVEDGNGDNYQVCFEWQSPQERGDNWYTLKQWRIVWIDIGQQVFDHPIVLNKCIPDPQTDAKACPTKHRAGMRCILFFLPPIQKAVIADHIKLADSPEILLLRCLEAGQIQDFEYARFMQRFGAITCESGLGIPLKFNPYDLPYLYMILKKIHEFTAQRPRDTWKDLFAYTHPMLAKVYQIVGNQCSRPTRAYIHIANTCLEDILPLDEIWIDPMPLGHPPIIESALVLTDSNNSLMRLFKKPSSQPSTPRVTTPRSPKNSPRRTIADELTSPAYSNPTRLRESEELLLENALVKVAKQFPWTDNTKSINAKTKLIWLIHLLKIVPKLSITNLKVSLDNLNKVLELALVNPGTQLVAQWLLQQGAKVDSEQLQLEMESFSEEELSSQSTSSSSDSLSQVEPGTISSSLANSN